MYSVHFQFATILYLKNGHYRAKRSLTDQNLGLRVKYQDLVHTGHFDHKMFKVSLRSFSAFLISTGLQSHLSYIDT